MGSLDEAIPIAIVGLGCRFPGGSSSGEKFWDLLVKKKSARKETPPDRFNVDSFYHPDGDRRGTVCRLIGVSRWAVVSFLTCFILGR